MKLAAAEVAGMSSPGAEEGMGTVVADEGVEEVDAEFLKDHHNAGRTTQTIRTLHGDNWNLDNPIPEKTDYHAAVVDVVVGVVVVEQGFDWAAEETMTVAGMAYRTPWERKYKNPWWETIIIPPIEQTIALGETGFKIN